MLLQSARHFAGALELDKKWSPPREQEDAIRPASVGAAGHFEADDPQAQRVAHRAGLDRGLLGIADRGAGHVRICRGRR